MVVKLMGYMFEMGMVSFMIGFVSEIVSGIVFG